MNILFAWTGITGYMGDCWRALAALPGVRLKVMVEAPLAVEDAAFDAAHELRDLDCVVVERGKPFDRAAIRDAALTFKPDALFAVGWHAALPRFLSTDGALRDIRKIIVFDLPFAFTPRKLLAPIALRGYLRHFDAAFVPGADAARYARWLGFRNIRRGLFSTRLDRFADVAESKLSRVVPHSFLYVGRYAPEKGLDMLERAYAIYRSRVSDPCPLDCAGMGPECPKGEGIRDLGFVAPDDLARVYGLHGVFVLPSRFEPWGVVVAEACGAAMPVICSDSVGARHELVDGNGFVCRTDDPASLADAMVRMHALSDGERLAMARKSLALSSPYSASEWAKRVIEIVKL